MNDCLRQRCRVLLAESMVNAPTNAHDLTVFCSGKRTIPTKIYLPLAVLR